MKWDWIMNDSADAALAKLHLYVVTPRYTDGIYMIDMLKPSGRDRRSYPLFMFK